MNNENADRANALIEDHGAVITQNKLLLESLIYQALNEAEARGRAAGLDTAATICAEQAGVFDAEGSPRAGDACMDCAKILRELIPLGTVLEKDSK